MSTNGDNLPDMDPHSERMSLERERELGRVPDTDTVPDFPGATSLGIAGQGAPFLPLAQLYAALALAQGEFPEIPKNRTATIRPKDGNPWTYQYSDLSDLIKATAPALAKNGLSKFQYPEDNECVTVLAHKSGVTIQSRYPIDYKPGGRMHPAQERKVAFEYARRYGLSGLLGIAAEETIEVGGGKSAGKSFEDPERDGILSVRGAKNTHDATPAELARSYGEAIEEQIGEAKTLTGLEGVWSRNEKVINRLQDSYLGDYENVSACYVSREAELKAEGA